MLTPSPLLQEGSLWAICSNVPSWTLSIKGFSWPLALAHETVFFLPNLDTMRMNDTHYQVWFPLFCHLICSSVFLTPIQPSPAGCLPILPGSLASDHGLIALIFSITGLWASSSAGLLLLLSNPLPCMSPLLPIPFPLVAVTGLLQLPREPLISFPPPLRAEGSLPSAFHEKTYGMKQAGSSFPLPHCRLKPSLLSVFLHEERPSMAALLRLWFPPLPSLHRINRSFLSPAHRRPLSTFSKQVI